MWTGDLNYRLTFPCRDEGLLRSRPVFRGSLAHAEPSRFRRLLCWRRKSTDNDANVEEEARVSGKPLVQLSVLSIGSTADDEAASTVSSVSVADVIAILEQADVSCCCCYTEQVCKIAM